MGQTSRFLMGVFVSTVIIFGMVYDIDLSDQGSKLIAKDFEHLFVKHDKPYYYFPSSPVPPKRYWIEKYQIIKNPDYEKEFLEWKASWEKAINLVGYWDHYCRPKDPKSVCMPRNSINLIYLID